MANEFMTWASLPIGANPDRDIPVGMTEWGAPIYQTADGHQYTMNTIQPDALPGDPWSAERVKAVLGDFGQGLLSSAVDAVTAPSRALGGEAVTNASVFNAAGLAQLGSVSGTAPKGAIRSGLSRGQKTAAQMQADEIMDMLRSGRGSQITDDMMAAADQNYLSSIYDLPLDEASRMQRASSQGYNYARRSQNPDTPFNDVEYAMFVEHDGDPWSALDGSIGSYGPHEYLGRSSSNVNDHMVDIMKAIRRRGLHEDYNTTASNLAREADPPSIVDSAGMWDAPDLAIASISDLFEKGIGSVSTQDGMIAWDPSLIRSIHARFDPRLGHLSNLNAANASPTAGMIGMFTDTDYSDLADYLSGVKKSSPVSEAIMKGRQ